MKKIHSRVKRRHALSTHKSQYDFFHPKKRRRPKTFKTENAANLWAKANKINSYFLKPVKRNKRFQVIENGQDKNKIG